MKKISLLFALTIYALTGIFGQSPDQFKYQALLRSADGTIMANESVSVYLEILQGSATGTSVFNETHNLTTTEQGLININIGSVEDLSFISWGADNYFIKITVNGTEMGTSQLLSVPYALYAKEAGSTDGHYLGELFGGGIIFFIDETGEHGLIAGLHDLDDGSGAAWSNIVDVEIGEGAHGFYDGAPNTVAIIGQAGHTNSAAKMCDDYSNEGYDDWYLPTANELLLIRTNAMIIHSVLENDGDPNTFGLLAAFTHPYSFYWSSLEIGSDFVWWLNMDYDTGNSLTKADFARVRPVRKF